MSADAAEFAIRSHLPADKPDLIAMLELAMVETYPDLANLAPADRATLIDSEFAHYYGIRDKIILVAEAADGVAGSLWAMESYHPVTSVPDMFIVNVAVYPRYRRRGLARRLMAEAATRAAARGLIHVRLFVNPRNDAARRLYERLGYLEQTREMRLDLG